MSYIFMDESGDLGFDLTKRNTSRFFMVTFLFAMKKRPIEKCVRSIHRGLRKKHKKVSGVLHASHEEPITRQRLLTKLNNIDCTIMTIYLNKENVYTRFQNEIIVLYNYVTNILLDRIFSKNLIPIEGPIHLVASKRETNKFLNENFRSYLREQTLAKHALDIRVEIKTPHEEKALQAVDFASWALFRMREYGDESYYQLFRGRVCEENSLFP